MTVIKHNPSFITIFRSRLPTIQDVTPLLVGVKGITDSPLQELTSEVIPANLGFNIIRQQTGGRATVGNAVFLVEQLAGNLPHRTCVFYGITVLPGSAIPRPGKVNQGIQNTALSLSRDQINL